MSMTMAEMALLYAPEGCRPTIMKSEREDAEEMITRKYNKKLDELTEAELKEVEELTEKYLRAVEDKTDMYRN